MVRVSAFNAAGSGPFSNPIPIDFDPLAIRDRSSLYFNGYFEATEAGGALGAGNGNNKAQYTWLIALLGSLAFMLILVSFVLIYYRKRPKYLAASTSDNSDNYHCTLKSVTGNGLTLPVDNGTTASLSRSNGQLWIDRYFEKEAKLISMSATMPNVKDNNSDYAYISDHCIENSPESNQPATSSGNTASNTVGNNRHSLSTFVSGLSGQQLMSASMMSAPAGVPASVCGNGCPSTAAVPEPEPYATTDILRAEKEKLQQNHYAVSLFEARCRVCGDMNSRNSVNLKMLPSLLVRGFESYVKSCFCILKFKEGFQYDFI